MARSASTSRRLVLLWTLIALIAALAAAVMVVIAGPLYSHQSIHLGTAFALLRHGAWVGIAAAAAAILALVATLLARRFGTSLVAVLALALGLGAFIWPWMMLRDAKTAPPIHDIATDPMHAPRFVALAKVRAQAPNGIDYGGGGAQMAKNEQAALAHFLDSPAGKKNPRHAEIKADCATWGPVCLAAVQHAYYPDIRPLPAPGVDEREAFTAALTEARAMGWKIATADGGTGHIEATATTAWFGFKDDIAIDVTPLGRGSVVDVRSESRLGLSDLGKNAQRVRAYLNALGQRLAELRNQEGTRR